MFLLFYIQKGTVLLGKKLHMSNFCCCLSKAQKQHSQESVLIKSLSAKRLILKLILFSRQTDIHLGTYWRLPYSFYVPLPYILHLTDSCPFSK